MICVVLLQNSMDVVEGEIGDCSGTDVTCGDGGTEEVSVKVEDAIDIKEEFSIKIVDAIDVKDEIPEAIIFTPVKTEQEVRLWGVCVVVAARTLRPFIACNHELETAETHPLFNYTFQKISLLHWQCWNCE